MKAKNTYVAGTQFTALTVLLVAAFALVVIVSLSHLTIPQAPSQPASLIQYRVDPAVRNHRLLELNEGIKPVVTAVPVDRNKRLLELNEGYAPKPFRSPRDQRLYELNR